MRHLVTVVVPVYGEPASCAECLDACKAYVRPPHRLLIIDDASPSSQTEGFLREWVTHMPNATFERNPQNLGFVGTCNRAAFELDTTENDLLFLNADAVLTEGALEEMVDVLYACDRHGACSPRGSRATIANVPLGEFSMDPVDRYACWRRIHNDFPRWSVVPTAIGFCILIRRELIHRFGLFDPIYSPGYDEENDFCCRIGRHGYSSVLAHHAFVFHGEGDSFGERRSALVEAHSAILRDRYPEFEESVSRYIHLECDALDQLGGAFLPRARPRIAIDLTYLPPVFNGSMEYVLSLLPLLLARLEEWADTSIVCTLPLNMFLGLERQYPNTVLYKDGLVFDLTFVPHQPFFYRHLANINAMSARIVVTTHDIIALRFRQLRTVETETAIRMAAQYADGIITVSATTLKDIQAYYADLLRLYDPAIVRPIHSARQEHASFPGANNEFPMPSTPFILLVGNAFEHKAIKHALAQLRGKGAIVVMGGWQSKEYSDDITFLPHNVSVATITALYEHARAVVYPSQYEGFGFPLLHAAAAGTPIILCELPVSREIVNAFDIEHYCLWFRQFEEIPNLLEQASLLRSSLKAAQFRYTWNDCAEHTAAFLREVAQRPINLAALRDRFSHIRTIEALCPTKNAKNVDDISSDLFRVVSVADPL